MGFFKDLNTMKNMGKEMQKTSTPGADLRNARDRMAAMNAAYAQTAPGGEAADAVDGTVQVVAVGMSTGLLNGNPMLSLQVLVQAPGLPPIPATSTVVVPTGQLPRVVVGATLPARISQHDPSTFTVAW